MRKLLAFLLALSLTAFSGEPKTVTLEVKNMSCELCPLAVKKALEKVSGVSAVEVDFASKTATVTYDPDRTEPQALVQATTDAGYPSTVRQ
ncbi:MAG: mercury resistance system periplasmic binding protein MerP [Methylohalobius sp.]